MRFVTIFFCTIIYCCCSIERNYPLAENALDAGREFIDASLKGNFEKAAFYMVNDDRNKSLLLKQQRNYKTKSNEEKLRYSEASIIINEDETINDSTHIINYQNSYDKVGRKVKVILHSNNWLVDFKYTFDGNF